MSDDLADYDFDLPDRLIAARAVEPRDAARLLVVRPSGPFEDRRVADLGDYLRAGDLLVVNDSKVIPARLYGVRARGAAQAAVEALLLRRTAPDRWRALARPGRRLAEGDRLSFGDALSATLVAKVDAGEVELRFDRAGADLDAAIAAVGTMPLPPYIVAQRRADDHDRTRYQTVYARADAEGSIAAPTAGLHFTPDLLHRLAARGIPHVAVTLHVGAGTFLPVKTDDLSHHRMHAEWGEVGADAVAAVAAARARGGRVIAVGTTAARLLESAAGPEGIRRPFAGETDIFIRPGYRFRVVDALMTNFHLPRSTLFVLVSALMGRARMQAAYAHAIAAGYRFYSYGDASLLLPETTR